MGETNIRTAPSPTDIKNGYTKGYISFKISSLGDEFFPCSGICMVSLTLF